MRAELVLLTVEDGRLKVMMTERDRPPFAGRYVLPGAALAPDEALEDCTRLLLNDHVELPSLGLELFDVFSDPGRDPNGRVVSAAYVGAVSAARLEWAVSAAHNLVLVEVATNEEQGSPRLSIEDLTLHVGFDHLDMVYGALEYLRRMLDCSLLPFRLLPERFTLLELQTVHELILGTKLIKPVFRKRMLGRIYPDRSRLAATGDYQHGAHRPAELYERRVVPMADPDARDAGAHPLPKFRVRYRS